MKLLLVEDDPRIASLLHQGLSEEGHQVDRCERGQDAMRQVQEIDYDLILLDWMLPDIDGLSLLRRWRATGVHTPVIMLTARGGAGERVTGLTEGADDYVVKPFDFGELVARIGAVFRRSSGQIASYRLGDLRLDGHRRRLSAGSLEIDLTPKEFSLCAALLARQGDVISRSGLIETVWGTDFAGDPNVLDVYIGYLRKKLAKIGTTARVDTVRGIGFRFVAGADGS